MAARSVSNAAPSACVARQPKFWTKYFPTDNHSRNGWETVGIWRGRGALSANLITTNHDDRSTRRERQREVRVEIVIEGDACLPHAAASPLLVQGLGRAEPFSCHAVQLDPLLIDGGGGVAERLLEVLIFKEGILAKSSSRSRWTARISNTRRTVIRMPRMHGFPPHLPGSTVMRSNAGFAAICIQSNALNAQRVRPISSGMPARMPAWQAGGPLHHGCG